MRTMRFIPVFLFIGLPSMLLADITPGELPSGSKWYFHVDFEEMREAEAGKPLYGWLQGEVFADVREDAGVDLEKEADRITAFAAADDGLVVLIEGNISQETQDKVMGMGAASGSMDRFESGGATYYYVKNGSSSDDESTQDGNVHSGFGIDSLQDGAYFSFAVKNKIIVTSSREVMLSMLASKGKISGGKNQDGALLVLSADRSLIQAGLDTNEIDDEMGWDSNILRNTEQLAVLVADEAGKIAIQAQLLTAKKEMAESLGSIVRGLISLQVFNNDLDPKISEFLQSTNVIVIDNKLTVKLALDPALVIAAIE